MDELMHCMKSYSVGDLPSVFFQGHPCAGLLCSSSPFSACIYILRQTNMSLPASTSLTCQKELPLPHVVAIGVS